MTALAYQLTLYEQLDALPEGLTGEILNGQLYTQPRPTGPHTFAESELNVLVSGCYGRRHGGPGGWWILVEPEIHFIRDTEVAVPDLAGWRRERMPRIPVGHRFEVAPDWVCEILSPSTASKDREIKLPLYAHYGVAHAWLVDPNRRTLEAYRLDDDGWCLVMDASGADRVRVPPFTELELDLATLWA